MPELRAHDVVRVRALPAYADATSITAPGLGDRGAVVEVLHAPSLGDRLLVECCDSRGRTLWLAEFPPESLVRDEPAPCESLEFGSMASGERCLALGRDVSWAAFPDYARAVARRLAARVVDEVDGGTERLLTIDVEGQRYWLTWDTYADHVSLEPCDAEAGRPMHVLRERLRASRGAADVAFRLRDEPGALARLDTGVDALDFFLRDELGTGGGVDEDSLTLEIARQLSDVRRGVAPRVANGSDAIFVSIEPAGVCLEYAMPGAPRPGVLVSLHTFADVFARWFEHANPTLGAVIRQVVWPPAARI